MDENKKRRAEDILSLSDDFTGSAPGSDEQELLANRIQKIVSASGNEALSPGKKATIWNHITAHIHLPLSQEKPGIIRNWIAIAASIVLLISFSLYFSRLYHTPTPVRQHAKNNTSRFKNDIQPGTNKAILTLANGARIVLDNASTGQLAQQGGSRISKTAQGQIAYSMGTADDAAPQMNSVSTPRGGQYQVVLPDGTMAWLNAASSLRFPTVFTGTERAVQVTGEVYFEVAKNKNMPFKVTANGMVVEVLGTHFDIKAYDDEKETKTTLLEGAVKLGNHASSVILTPGQQALVNNHSGSIRVQPANLDAVMAWKKGIFVFKKENIKSIMRDLSRWYDVDIDYKGEFADADFSGRISRYSNISQVLDLLELTDDVHFKIEGRRLTVMP